MSIASRAVSGQAANQEALTQQLREELLAARRGDPAIKHEEFIDSTVGNMGDLMGFFSMGHPRRILREDLFQKEL